mmetsp:Transcript_12222/g.16667  ORF Transcript_12222/g.16667 Transcript_12222/m.16667 type:complete len:922 (-) Transcript_12222:537-3302(-)|eukprot:CAMPEP_0196587014 /NCGR_PEP_ID=MMETSP1081-20130531/56159_1 /TAXON_ID=36882 /ORGANISM="Pyramimonas amylifera, Strain CCMP720" /LENGTH=921 /DNA_ID=CAMNT_0041909067 /DNA_START=251 /DNA_END=3016 /DNA_ORIENTATION=+
MTSAAPAWQPRPEGVEQIVNLLVQYMQPTVDQSQIFAQLQHCSTFPDFNNYLVYILASGGDLGHPIEVRQSAGLLLKNNLKTGFTTTTPEYQAFIKHHILRSVGVPDRALRSTVGTVISVIAAADGVAKWPEMSLGLAQCLYSEDFDHTEGALDALYKICEDIPTQLDEEVQGLPDRPSNVFIPRLLALFASPHTQLRRLSVGCVNFLLATMPPALFTSLDRYLQELFNLRSDPAPEVRKLVCSGLVLMISIQPERLGAHLRELIQFMLQSTQDADTEVALESCEFWSAFCESHLTHDHSHTLKEFLPQLIPVLLSNMSYDEDEEEVIAAEAEESNADRPDRDQDIKPFIHASRAAVGGEGAEEEDDDDEVSAWNLRKCSAAGLDILSNLYGDDLLPIMLPIVEQRLTNQDWKVRESAILALGAVAEGCARGLLNLLPRLVQFLVPLLDDPRPLVRSISCWSLSRFAKWLVEAAAAGGGKSAEGGAEASGAGVGDTQYGQQQLDGVLSALLRRVMDQNKRVQEAACSALATLEEEAGARGELLTRVNPILTTLMQAFATYQRKNLRILYDAIGTLADAVGSALAEPSLSSTLVPPLLAKWAALGDGHKDLFPLLECLSSVAQALGPAFHPYAQGVFHRAMGIVHHQLQLKSSSGELEKEFVVCAVDLMCVVVAGLGASAEPLVGAAAAGLRDLILNLCQDQDPDVRQSAFELMGDLCKVCASHLAPSSPELFSLVCHNLSPALLTQPCNFSACNNACWAAGELAVKLSPETLAPHVPALLACLAPMLQEPSLSKSLHENATITIGRIGLMNPELVSPHLDKFMAAWLRALRSIRDDVEKEQAFLGLCKMLHLNPAIGLTHFVPLCQAISSWWRLHNQELHSELGKITRAYKDYMSPEDWARAWGSLEETVQQKLSHMFGTI